MVAHPGLLLATLALCANFADLLPFVRVPPWAHALWRLATLAVLTVLVARALGSPLDPHLHLEQGWTSAWERCVEAGWCLVAARSAVAFAHALLLLQNGSRETQILSDLVRAAIYLATALAIVDRVFEVPIRGLLATSGVIAIVIGLALQSTLADVFSGIAVDIERPYRAGDLIWVEGGIEGHVREVTWRSTHIATGNGDIAVVPNSVMAKAKIINHSLPVPVRNATVEVRLDPTVASERCLAVLDAAVKACGSLLPSPAPSLTQTALQGDAAVYEITFSVPLSESLGAARTELFGRIRCHLDHAAIPLAIAGTAPPPRAPPPTPAEVLARSDLFGALSEAQLAALADRMVEVRLRAGTCLFRQDDVAEALYVLTSGTLEVTRREQDDAPLRHRISPGACFGIMGLITASAYAAGVVALTDIVVFRLDKPNLAAALARETGLKAGLEDLARREQAWLSEDIAAQHDHRLEHPDVLVSRVRSFLHRLLLDAPPALDT